MPGRGQVLVCIFFASFASFAVQAIRDESFKVLDEVHEAPRCPEAERFTKEPFPTRFELPSETAKFVNFFEKWTLKESETCSGEPACPVSIAPLFNSSSPLNSTAVITVRASCRHQQKRRLFLCLENGTGGCWAAVRFPARPWRLRHLVSPFISETRILRMDSVGRDIFQDFFLEGLFSLNVLCTLGVIGWLIREIVLTTQKIRNEAAARKVDAHLVVPSSLDIMFEGMLDAVCFIIGCMLLLLAASTFLQKFGTGQNPADILLLCYPLIFGPFALLRIFLCFNRRLLYHNLFLKGVMIDFSAAASSRDPLLLYTYLGFAIVIGVLAFDALQSAQEGHVEWTAMAIQTVVFTSPLYYMISSLLDSIRLEKEALNSMCLQKLESGSDTTNIEPFSAHQLTPISEGVFCRAARERQDLDACIEMAKVEETANRLRSATSLSAANDDTNDDKEVESDYFKLMDMFWVPRLVSGRSKWVSILLVVSMPIMTLLAMLLGLASLAWLIKHRYDVPEIVELVTDVPGLTPDFHFEVMDYALMMPRALGTTTLSASSELERTHYMTMSVLDGDVQLGENLTSTSERLTDHVELRRKNTSYPTSIQLFAGTISKVRTYRITVLEVHILFRSLMLHGETTGGLEYRQCLPFNRLSGRRIALPSNLSSLRMEVAFQEVELGLPVSEPTNTEDFVAVFKEIRYDVWWPTCQIQCSRNPRCYSWKQVREGCYFVFGPMVQDISCKELHKRRRSETSRVQISARFCNTHQLSNCAQTQSVNHVVSGSVTDQVLGKFGKRSFTKPSSSLNLLASMTMGSISYPDQPRQVHFRRDTPSVQKLLFRGCTLVQTQEQPDGTQYFRISKQYDPADYLESHFTINFAAILDDQNDFEMKWEAPMKLVDLAIAVPRFRCDPSLQEFEICGGFLQSFTAEALIDKWSPHTVFRGQVVSKHHPELFRPRLVEIELVFRDGTVSPLQYAVQQNCNVPICRGGPDENEKLLKCLADAEERKCFKICREDCLKEAQKKCTDTEPDPFQREEKGLGDEEARKKYLGYVSLMPKRTLSFFLTNQKEFLHWLEVDIYEEYYKYFTGDVLVAVAEHCSFGSGVLSLLRPGRMNTSVPMLDVLEALARNPSFSFNATFSKIPVLRALFDDRKEDFLRPIGSLATVALYRPSLRPLTLAVCVATDPLSGKFVDPDLFGHIIEKMRIAIAQNDAQEADEGSKVLEALSMCIQGKGRRFQRFSWEACRSTSSANTLEDGSKPSFYTLAPTEEAFMSLLPVCETGGFIETDDRTILHVAAEKNFGKAMMEILAKNVSPKSQKLKNEIIPDVNAPYHGMHMIDAQNAFGRDHQEDTSIYLRFDGRAAIHDACRSGCVLCVKALLLRDASAGVSLNLTMFPAWWDPAFHPWMYNYLSHSTQKNSQKYRSIWNVRPIHIAATHNCSECLEALVEDLSPKEIDAAMILGHTTTFFRKKFTFDELHKNGFERVDESTATCSFRALDLAVMLDCKSCAEILIKAGANTSQIVLDVSTSTRSLQGLQMLPDAKIERCLALDLARPGQFSVSTMFAWI